MNFNNPVSLYEKKKIHVIPHGMRSKSVEQKNV